MKNGSKTVLNILFFNRPHYRLLIIGLSLASALLGLSVPYYQKQFSIDLSTGTLVLCVFLALAYLATNQLALFIGQSESVQAQKKLSEVIYQQNLKLKPLTLQNKSVGEVISIYSTDVPSLTVWLEQSLPYGLTTAFPLILTPFFLHHFYSLPLGFSLGLVLALVALNSFMAYRQAIFFFRFKMLAAERMGLVNEWVQNIRGLKVLNWVEGFENKIIKKRREETVNRINMLTNGQIMNSISSSMMFWLNIAMLGFFIWFHDSAVTKADIITLLWVTTVFLSRPLRQLPWFFTFVFDAWTSYKRIVEFLDLTNTPEVVKNSTQQNADALLEVKNLNLKIGDRTVLNQVNFEIYKGEIVALIGPVGSGKSLLIKSLISETPFTADQFYKSKTSYLPQEHFIMSASLRDNMNFRYHSGIEFDGLVMNHLEKAQFNFELDRVQQGLDTVIGERGVNLSGGQKQRVSLGRQLMNSESLLLLDDPLSAVDLATENKLISELVNFKNNGGSILLTTQRFTALPQCDRILFLEAGQIIYNGPSHEFLNDIRFQSFIKGLV